MVYLSALLLTICFILADTLVWTEPKISNGFAASRGQFPYLASYQYRGGHFCGCSILNAEWLMTAAHCVDEALQLPIHDLKIAAGATKLNEMVSHMQITSIRSQYMHPFYAGGISPNDIGLIRVKKPFKWTADVDFIALPFEDREYNGLTLMAGWGYLRTSYPMPSSILQYARGACNSIVNQFGVKVDSRSICSIGHDFRNETSCKGDSGGPLVYPDVPGRPVLIGVMSWNLSPCGLRFSPSVSTKVSRYISWIKCRVEAEYVDPSKPCY